MDLNSILARLAEIDIELGEIEESPTEESEARAAELVEEVRSLTERVKVIEERDTVRNEIRNRIAQGKVTVEAPHFTPPTDNPYGASVDSADRTELRGRALKAVEKGSKYELDDKSKERITTLVEQHDGRNSPIAKRVLLTGSDEYKSAFAKVITGQQLALSPEESAAFSRAMSLTDGAGGFAVPFPIDPTLIFVGSGSISPFREVARVIPNWTTDTWQGLASTQLSASFDAEAAEVSDDTTTFTQPAITVRTARAFVPASFEIAGDYPNLVGDLTELFADAKMVLEDTVFATGSSGANQPIGIVTALTGTSSVVTSAATDVFAAADVYNVSEALPPRFRSAASRVAYLSNLSIYHDIRQFGTAGNPGPFLTEPNADTVLGRPWLEASAMDGTITAAADNYVLVVGDWRNYVIVDRVGFNIEFVPHMFATANNLPSGQRGWLAWWRVGADSVNDNAFRILNVT
jgi:HK97 family phage major capsid protein